MEDRREEAAAPLAPPVPWPAVAGADAAMPQIAGALERSLLALEAQCARTSVAYFYPGLRALPGLEQVHKENYEVSYHLTTALGSARAIMAGERLPGYYGLVLACQKEALEHQQKAVRAWGQMLRAAAPALQPAVHHLGAFLHATARTLAEGYAWTTHAFGPGTAQALLAWVEQVAHS